MKYAERWSAFVRAVEIADEVLRTATTYSAEDKQQLLSCNRDVKPDNIVIGHGDRVRLLDCGACLLLPRFYRRHLVFPATPAEERSPTSRSQNMAVTRPGPSVTTSRQLRPRPVR